ncbi:MAG TPA: DUF5947 family protein [Bryobacteraceae bacterium]|nr:DUF5947 family protein [Bryobacteraceae bacterium]
MSDSSPAGSFSALRRFVRRPTSAETCELCSLELASIHQHLLEPTSRKLICACDACAILFSNQGQSKYKRVPRRVRYLADFRLSDSQWDGLMMPINMAFFVRSTPHARVMALYPSPAGATESLLSFDTWEDIERENPALLEMEADVEALLVNRIGHSRGFSNPEYYIVPIDECFRLVGLIRSRWQGLSGGAEVWKEIGQFFGGLKDRADIVAERTHA